MKGELQGRVVYLEPNDFRNQIGASYGSGDNVYWRPEDLSIAVDLQVIIPDRNSCGSDIYENFNVTINSKDGDSRWTSFFRGTEINGEPYLTDSFTDISYQEISQNRAGNKETLGIKSIDIQFDSHFYPVVKMRLVDVRGASLMMPAEANFDEKEKVCQEFFNALFHFPYPRFALSIKGFYGTRVTFMLAVNDFQSSFNSQTGNFDVEVSFIGHMYGLYTDIPMSCLLVAPYMGAGVDTVSKYWRDQTSNNGAFFFKDGSTIPTFKQFLNDCEDIQKNFEKFYKENGENFKSLKEIEKLRNERSSVSSILSEYENLIKEIKNKNSENGCLVVSANGHNIYFVNSNTYSLPSYNNFNEHYSAYLDIADKANTISKPIGLDGKQWGANNIPINEKKTLVYSKISDNDEQRKIYEINTDHPFYEIVSGISENIKFEDYAGKHTFAIKIDENFIINATRRCTDINNEIDKILGRTSEELSEVSKQVLGFTPTIENIIRMTFAHIDAFMHEYYNLLDKIRGNSAKRNKKTFKGINKIFDDVESNSGNYTYPPFTGFFEDDKETGERVRKYPGKINELSEFDEVDFVNRIFRAIDAAENDSTEPEPNKNSNNANSENKKDWMPLSVLDALETENPYMKFTPTVGTDDYIEKLLIFIWDRFNSACAYTKAYSEDGTNAFNTNNEVENFWNIYGKSIVNCDDTELKKIKDDIDRIIGTGSTENILNIVNKNSNIKFKKDSILQQYKNTHFIVPEGNSWILEKMLSSDGASKFNIKTDWDYSVDKGFLSNIYHEKCFQDEIINGENVYVCNQKNINDTKSGRSVRKEWAENAAIENRVHEQYMFPILQFYNESYEPCNFFSDMKEEDFTDINFLSAFLGTTDIYRFSKKDSSIRRIPKVFALYLGSLINLSKISDFNVDKNGYLNFSTESEKIKNESNGFKVEDIKNRDEDGGLRGYYEQWASNYGVNKFKSLSDSKETFQTKFRFNTSYRDRTRKGTKINSGYYTIPNCITKYTSNSTNSPINEYTKEMVDLASSMVTVLSLYTANKKMTPRFKNIVSFFTKLKQKIEKETKNSNNSTKAASDGNTDAVPNAKEPGYAKTEAMEQMYYTLKNLYDKWLSCYNRDRFKLDNPMVDSNISNKKNEGKLPCTTNVSEVQCFMYVDTFYQNIGDKFLVNPNDVAELIKNYENRSVMQFISDIAQKNKLLFVALPVFSNMYDSDTIGSIFTPHSLYGENEFASKSNNSRGIGNTYVLMYTHEPSHFTGTDRNKNTTEYKSSSLSFNKESKLVTLSEHQQDGKNYTIPAFGVTFGKQDQMYFKNINVNMANPRETDVAIANRFALAENEKHGESRLSPNLNGQNLYSIYSNRSYECSVDMMGCANIMPLMYFQLNNIPLFNGAYIIYGVKHHIESGSMLTSFTGVRVSSNAIPINSNVIDVESLLNNLRRTESNVEENEDKVIVGEGNKYTNSVSYNMLPIDKDGRILTGNDIITQEMVYDEKLPVLNIPKGINYLKDKGVVKSDGTTIYPYNVANFANRTGVCATAVKTFLRAALSFEEKAIKNIQKCNGFACSGQVESWGYKEIINIKNNKAIKDFSGPFEPGDICCTNYPGATYGHIAIFDGNTFISDCVQTGDRANGTPNNNTDVYILYRYKGPVIPPDYYTVISFNIEDGIIVNKSSEGWASDGEIITNGRNIIVKKLNSQDKKSNIYFKGKSETSNIIVEVTSYVENTQKKLGNAVEISKENKKEALVHICNDDNIGSKVIITFKTKKSLFG